MTSFRRAAIRFAVPGLLMPVLVATTSAANAANWKLDLGKSKLGFSGTQTGTKFQGVTKPLTLPFTLETNGTSAHATGHAELIRSAFGIGQGPWTTDQWVALNVGVDIDVTATREN
jgi:polyisoprenoid-binding protein YceI